MTADPYAHTGVPTARPGLLFQPHPDPLRSPLANRLRQQAADAGWTPTTCDRSEALAWLAGPVEVQVLLYNPTRVHATLIDPTDEPITALIATVGHAHDPMTTAHQLTDLLTSRSTR